mgnify:CR=1 FL=1
MIEILQETTDWGDAPVANGIYHVNVQGHLVQHNDKVFKNPMKQFSKARRTFEKIGEYADPQTRPDVKFVILRWKLHRHVRWLGRRQCELRHV